MHSVPEVTSLIGARVLLPAAALGALGVIAFRVRRLAPLPVFGLAWFFLLLAPSSLVPLDEAMAEHRVYLASAGFFLAVGAAFGWLFGRLEQPSRRSVAVGALAVMLVTLGALTVARAEPGVGRSGDAVARRRPESAGPVASAVQSRQRARGTRSV